eukprot:GHRR01020182.1.p1 GENE.GHRR01020182.1~~GHRR01020182.1.p1  ORF type:complete len:162 (-),score=24.72 GHRR01020182.1:469-954(-)
MQRACLLLHWHWHCYVLAAMLPPQQSPLLLLVDVACSFWDEALDWGTKSTINFLAGSIAWLFGLILWITAMEWVRRRLFEVFYKMHITCFLGFLVFGMIHFWWNWGIFVPGGQCYIVVSCPTYSMTHSNSGDAMPVATSIVVSLSHCEFEISVYNCTAVFG